MSFAFSKREGSYALTSYGSLVSQVLTNIIFNAAEYSDPAMGVVEISLAFIDGVYLFSCKDNGIGIPAEDQKSIFSKFFRAPNAMQVKAKGTGLGLFLVKMIADNLGWGVSFESPAENGRGTIFYLRIPKVSEVS